MEKKGQIRVDSQNIMPIIKKWLYSDKDIFLRELVSNACDAVAKYKKLVTLGNAPDDAAGYRVNVYTDKDNGLLKVEDNGLGMTGEQVKNLFSAADHVPSRRGSGIGVRNVNERIKLYFGKDYGLSIDSEPDEGTTVTAHLPAVPYGQVTEKQL